MNWFKFVFAAALAIILVVSTLVGLFGAGRVVNAVLRTYILGVEDCQYKPRPLPVEREGAPYPTYQEEEKCSINHNQAKREVADGLSMLFVAAPLAWFMYGQTRRMMGEVKHETHKK